MRRRTLKPLTLLLLSLLCYGFMMVWTEKATLETAIDTEEPAASPSPILVKVLTGGNLSVSVSIENGTSVPPTASAEVIPTTQSTTNEDTTPLPVTSGGATSPLCTTDGSLSTGIPTGGREAPTSAIPDVDETSTRIPTIDNVSENHISSTTSGRPRQVGSCRHPEPSGSTFSSENCSGVSTGTVMTNKDTDPVTSSTRVSTKNVISRPGKRNTSVFHEVTGRMTWRVKLRSNLSKRDAITLLFEKACDLILKIPPMKDVIIMWGPNRTEMKCGHAED